MLRRIMLPLIAAIAISHPTGAQPLQSNGEPPKTVEAVASAFVDITLRAEYPGSGPALTLTRWEKPITWAMVGDAPEEVRQAVASALARASALSGGKVSARYLPATVLRPERQELANKNVPLKDDPGTHVSLLFDQKSAERPIVTTYLSSDRTLVWAANLTVYFGDKAFLSKIAKVLPGQSKAQADDLRSGAADCMAYIWTAKETKDIAHAAIIITDQVHRPALMKCIWEEVGQVLGIRNDLKDADFSVFTNNTGVSLERWTAFDEAAIQMLYDTELSVGMGEGRVRTIVHRIASKYFSKYFSTLQ